MDLFTLSLVLINFSCVAFLAGLFYANSYRLDQLKKMDEGLKVNLDKLETQCLEIHRTLLEQIENTAQELVILQQRMLTTDEDLFKKLKDQGLTEGLIDDSYYG